MSCSGLDGPCASLISKSQDIAQARRALDNLDPEPHAMDCHYQTLILFTLFFQFEHEMDICYLRYPMSA